MSSAGFPINDLLRRRLQTSLTIATLTLSVASTLFLLFFSSRLGFNIASVTGTLTQGLSAIFSQFIFFIGILIFAVGAVLTSFIVFLMMAQRTRDFGLIKAAGCPNSLVGGYFMTELLLIVSIGCILGILFGFLADFAVANVIFSTYEMPNIWFSPLVFIVFFISAFLFGLQPILKASKMSPAKALSTTNYYGLTFAPKHRTLPHSALTWRVATRSLTRRQSASIRIIILLSIVFILLTVSIAGGIIASETTISWVQKATDPDTVIIAHKDMENQYKLLLSKFAGAKETGDFDYSDRNLAISSNVINAVGALPCVSLVDSRLIVKEHVKEISNFTINPDTLETFPVGDSRESDCIVIGVNPQQIAGEWSLKGRFIGENNTLEAVIGDSIAQSMYKPYASRHVIYADPLVEGIEMQNITFRIVGVVVDPTNNGLITYVPITTLENVTGLANPNLLLVKLNNSTDHDVAIVQIKSTVQAINPDLDVFTLDAEMTRNTVFLSSNWQTIMLLPLFTLASAALCLVGYMMLTVDEQHQEFAVLRAVGAKPKVIVRICAIQSVIVLICSFVVGISLGIITTVLILMTNPVVTSLSVAEIAVWLIAALVGMFLLSLLPAYRIAKASILKIMT